MMVSRSGAERILAFLGRGAIVGELGDHRWAAGFGIRGGAVPRCVNASAKQTRRWQPVASFRSKAGWPEHCSSWRNISGKKSGRGGSHHPSEDQADRPCRHGRRCTRDRHPHPQ
jgi:hypothetical protein